MSDFMAAFRSAMAEYDLVPPEIVADGSLHRFSANGNHDLAGWYTLFPDGVPAGAFGNWRSGLKVKWSSKEDSELTTKDRAEQQKRWRLAKELRDRGQAQRHQQAKAKALSAWERARPATTDHPNLARKQVQPHGPRVNAAGTLLVPIYHFSDSGGFELWAVQEILGNGTFSHRGDKRFPLGSMKKGGFFSLGETGGDTQLYFCEGFATGASIHEATGKPIICCFDAGNLEPVISQWRVLHPGREFVICGDDDQYGAQNAGRDKAEAAAKNHNCLGVFPKFTALDTEPTDFNDLHCQEGLQAVKEQLEKTNTSPNPDLSPEACRVSAQLTSRPPERPMLMTLEGVGVLPAGIVAMWCATGGTGKTFLLLNLSFMAAYGRAFAPFEFTKALKVLFFSLEDDLDELFRRLWDISGDGSFSRNLYVAAYPGEIGPLMQLADGSSVRSDTFHWFDRELEKYQDVGLDLVILDTQSRFNGLSENTNEHGAAFISALEYIASRHKITIMVVAHTNEESVKNPPRRMTKAMLRGASSIGDNVRAVFGMREMTEVTARTFAIKDFRNYVELDTPKANRSARFPFPLFYKMDETGVLHYTNLYTERMDDMAHYFVEVLSAQDKEFTIRELEKEKIGKVIHDQVAEKYPKFRKREDTRSAIDYAQRKGWVRLVKETIVKGREKEVIRVLSTIV